MVKKSFFILAKVLAMCVSATLSILLLILLLLYFFFHTSGGLNSLIQITNQYAQHILTIESGRGHLGSDFTLENIRVNLPNHSPLFIDALSVKWEPLSLFDRDVLIEKLIVVGSEINLVDLSTTIETSKDENKNIIAPFEEFNLPFQVSIESLSLLDSEAVTDDFYLTVSDLEIKNILFNESQLSISSAEGNLYVIDDTDSVELPMNLLLGGVINLSTQAFELDLDLYFDAARINGHSLGSTIEIGLLGDLSKFDLALEGSIFWLDYIDTPIEVKMESHVVGFDEIESSVYLQSQLNELTLNGSWFISDPPSINVKIGMDVSDLSQIYPSISGEINGNIELDWNSFNPQLIADVKVERLSTPDIELPLFILNGVYGNGELMGTLEMQRLRVYNYYLRFFSLNVFQGVDAGFGVDLSFQDFSEILITNIIIDEDVTSDIQVTEVAQTLVNEGSYQATGLLEAHNFNFSLSGPEGAFDIGGLAAFDPSLEQPYLNLYLTDSIIKSSLLGNFALNSPAHLYFNFLQREIILTTVCYKQDLTLFCLEGARDHQGVNTAVVTLNNLPLSKWEKYLIPGVTLESDIQIVMAGHFTSIDDFSGVAYLSLSRGEMGYRYQGQKLQIPLEKTQLELSMKPDKINGSLQVDWGEYLQVKGVGSLSQPFVENNVELDLLATLPSMMWVSSLWPELKDLSGNVDLTASMSGTLNAPLMNAHLSLDNGHFYLAPLDSYFSNIYMDVILQEATSEFLINGGFNTGKGALIFDGFYDIANFNTVMSLSGKNLLLADSEDFRLIVSPQLTFTGQNKHYDLNGEIDIPELFYRHVGQSSGQGAVITVSQDTVIIDNEMQDLHQDFMNQLALDVGITLGNQILVGLEGSKVNLIGELQVLKEYAGQLRVFGGVDIKEGEVDIYGRTFYVDRGRLRFSGLPLDQTSMDIRVSRRFINWENGRDEDVGVIISGTFSRPRLELYSAPQLSEIAMISYLVLGRRPQLNSQVEYLMLINMLQRVARGESILNINLGPTYQRGGVGIIETPNGYLGVGIGRYLTKSFYVGIGIGVEGNEGKFMIARYYFLRGLSLNTAFSSDSLELNLNYIKEF